MRRSLVLSLILFSAITAPIAGRQPVRSDDALQTFWKMFKSAVISGNKQVVAKLSSFPIGMSYGIPRIRTRAELLRRYRQVFSEQTDAANCFAEAQPKIDPEKPTRVTVGCRNEAGDEVVIYHFRLTRTGWKFIALDNLNE